MRGKRRLFQGKLGGQGYKEKNDYEAFKYGIQKNSNDDPICETAKETQM